MKNVKPDTILTHAGSNPGANHGIVNPPVYHASTMLFPTVESLEDAGHSFEGVRYGRIGTPTSQAFETAVAELEGAYKAVTVPSGLAAITTALLAFVSAGDHILVSDSVYGPNRLFCSDMLKRMGVEAEFYDPLIGAGIGRLMRPNTRVVFVESPGSLTFEIQDVPAIAAAAKDAGAVVMIDNTWATPLFFRPFDHGVDLSIHAATKYMVGHSDAMLGVITARTPELWHRLKRYAVQLGTCAGPDDIYLGLRGLRTMGTRLRQHQATGIELAQWLRNRQEVARVLHPALPDDPGHALWRRDFLGASGLFAMELKPVSKQAISAFLNGMELFGMGYSWGGYESLILPANPEKLRTASTWKSQGPMIRLHAGLEDIGDLIADLERGLSRLGEAA
ncbi:cystathionine beta-lyase [Skermanella aerolata]|uniref:Cystathionine beta-lyase n=1 Tax=Skermanella aerolata TaxID=393310 RepID=A0A512DKK9_9PROT|nr:cystathionine beta-lyase [Skermanella aerolata]KJB97075.1 cystathionine beta-lyase [Skermanella aerolata KACC 11604]GEO36730.1 cystathionine beta-lyase [Skermanella aerolata]